MTDKKGDIQPYPKNAKKHPDEQILALADIIKFVGWRQPVVVNQKRIIVAGHGRWFTWKKHKESHGLKDVWVMDDKGNTIMGAPETKPLTKDQETVYRIADNKLNESEWDREIVLEELKTLPSTELVAMTGYDLNDLEVNFEPDESEQSKLDEKKKVECPNCHEIFTP